MLDHFLSKLKTIFIAMKFFLYVHFQICDYLGFLKESNIMICWEIMKEIQLLQYSRYMVISIIYKKILLKFLRGKNQNWIVKNSPFTFLIKHTDDIDYLYLSKYLGSAGSRWLIILFSTLNQNMLNMQICLSYKSFYMLRESRV